jgi:hypothetical protein
MAKKYNIQAAKAKKISKEKAKFIESETEEGIEEQPEMTPKEIEERMKLIRVKMYRTSLISYGIAAIFFIFSALIMTNTIEIPESESTAVNVLVIFLKGLLPVFFFFFMLISTANLLEARGTIMTWKEMLVIILMAVFQVVIEGYVVLITIIGVALVITYFYFIQAKTEKF